jgi:hypothetical protein
MTCWGLASRRHRGRFARHPGYCTSAISSQCTQSANMTSTSIVMARVLCSQASGSRRLRSASYGLSLRHLPGGSFVPAG